MSALSFVGSVVIQSCENVAVGEAGAATPTNESHALENVSNLSSSLPERPCSAVFVPGGFVGAVGLVSALDRCQISKDQVRCLQRLFGVRVCVTFCNSSVRDNFVKNSVLEVRGRPPAIQDADHPLTFLQIHGAPRKLPDAQSCTV